jgi:hypothetical protein
MTGVNGTFALEIGALLVVVAWQAHGSQRPTPERKVGRAERWLNDGQKAFTSLAREGASDSLLGAFARCFRWSANAAGTPSLEAVVSPLTGITSLAVMVPWSAAYHAQPKRNLFLLPHPLPRHTEQSSAAWSQPL